MATTFARARLALRTYYDAALGKLPVKSFDEFVENYRTKVYPDGEVIKFDDFLDSFDGALKYSSSIDTTAAMKSLASATPKGKLPSSQAFFKALSNQVESLTAKEFTNAVGAGIKEAAVVATAGIGAGIGIYILFIAGALLLPQLLAKKE